MDVHNQRQFFCEVAAQMGFDPMEASDWKQVTWNNIVSRGVMDEIFSFATYPHFNKLQQGTQVLHHYSTLRDALRQAFPELHFDDLGSGKWTPLMIRHHKHPFLGTELQRKPKNYWADPKHCRAFFDEYAQQRGLDPLLLSTWYRANFTHLRAQTVRVLRLH